MASSSFRDSINSLGWSRRDEPANTAPQPSGFFASIQNLNPFQDSGYLRLPVTETPPGAPLPAPSRREEEEGWFARKFASSLVPVCFLSSFVLCAPSLTALLETLTCTWIRQRVLFLPTIPIISCPNITHHITCPFPRHTPGGPPPHPPCFCPFSSAHLLLLASRPASLPAPPALLSCSDWRLTPLSSCYSHVTQM